MGEIGGKPVSGSIPLGNDKDHGARGMALLHWLNALAKVEGFDACFIERPLDPRVLVKIGATFQTAMLAYGLPFLAKAVLHGRGVYRVEFVGVQDVREHFVGKRTFKPGFDPVKKKPTTSRAEAKQATINVCRMIGWSPKNDDEADALALWSYATSRLDPKRGMRPTPLFARAS